MRTLYSTAAPALRDALRHAVERGGMSTLGMLHQAMRVVLAHVAPLLAANGKLHRAIIAYAKRLPIRG